MSWLSVAALGGFVGLDGTSFPQAMFSRPLPAGVLTGLLFGRPMEGALIGGILEVFALVVLPVGAARYPESGTGAVAASAGYVSVASGLEPALLLLAVVFAFAWERVTGLSVTWMRRVNERVVITRSDGRAALDRVVERRHLAAMALDFGRGALVTVAGGWIASNLIGRAGPWWILDSEIPLGLLTVAGAAASGAVLTLFSGGSGRWAALLLGVGLGSMLLMVS